jgi:hypothetical protein
MKTYICELFGSHLADVRFVQYMLRFASKGSMGYLSPLEGRKVEHSLTVRVTRNEGHLLLPVQFHHNYGELKYVA